MVDSMSIDKSINISIGTVMKNAEMLKFVSDHLKTKKICKHALKNLPCLLRYVPDQYKTRQVCDKAFLENGGVLKFVLDCYKIQEMYNKAVYKHLLTLGSNQHPLRHLIPEAISRCMKDLTILITPSFHGNHPCDTVAA